jgi:hypothetical protein
VTALVDSLRELAGGRSLAITDGNPPAKHVPFATSNAEAAATMALVSNEEQTGETRSYRLDEDKAERVT